MDKTVGLIGYGNMGKSTAKRLSGFGCKVVFYDKDKRIKSDAYAECVELNKLFEIVDIVSFHIPLWKENLYYIDDAFIASFQKPVFLINTARGKIVRLKTIYKGLESGKLRGVALDVFGTGTLDQAK